MVRVSATLYEVPQPGDWAELARCRTAPTTLFFPVVGNDAEQAKAICAGCPVLHECRTFALSYPGLHGVWGGLSEDDRAGQRRKDRAASR